MINQLEYGICITESVYNVSILKTILLIVLQFHQMIL